MTNTKLITAIDVGTTKVCVLVAELLDNHDYEILGVGVAPSKGLRRGVVVNMEEAQTSIREAVEAAERSAGYEIDRAFCQYSWSTYRCY